MDSEGNARIRASVSHCWRRALVVTYTHAPARSHRGTVVSREGGRRSWRSGRSELERVAPLDEQARNKGARTSPIQRRRISVHLRRSTDCQTLRWRDDVARRYQCRTTTAIDVLARRRCRHPLLRLERLFDEADTALMNPSKRRRICQLRLGPHFLFMNRHGRAWAASMAFVRRQFHEGRRSHEHH